MGLFNIFKKEKSIKKEANITVNKSKIGPYYLQKNTEDISNSKNIRSNEWKGNVVSESGSKKFHLKYYGQLDKGLITSTEDSEILLYAVDPDTAEKILLFDGCKHGYNAQFCDKYSKIQIENRPLKDFKQKILLEITILVINGIDYDDEQEDFIENVDNQGVIELVNGFKISFEEAKANGFTSIQIFGKTEKGNRIEILSEELS